MDTKRPDVLLVDDERGTIETLGFVLEREGFRVTLHTEPDSAIAELGRSSFDAVVSDVVFEGTAAGGRVLRAARELRPDAVVVLMTGYPLIEGAVAAMKDGAADYLQKPVDPTILAATLHRALRERSLEPENLEFAELVDILSGMVANTIERIDPYTAGHGERTRRYCGLIAASVGLDERTRERLELAAIAHDYGKIYLDDIGFLTKKGPLTDSEYLSVQAHPRLGAEKLGSHPRLQDVCLWVAEHHERWDGQGYPDRKKCEETSLPGRILGVVEVFDSLATERSYKKAWKLPKMMEWFEGQRGKAFDPDVVDVFLDALGRGGDAWIQEPRLDLAGVPAPVL